MDVFEHHIKVEKTARYFVAGPRRPIGRIWALHGYGQLPAYFLRRFEPAVAAGWQVIAPEGLHRFYVDGTSGRVGASWMTKEARETDIADYIAYLNRLHGQLAPVSGPSVLLGFSQGVATAARWAAEGNCDFKAHLFWAGVFPPDLDQNQELASLRNAPAFIILGDDDPFFHEDLITKTESDLQSIGVNFQLIRFKGAHEINGQILAELIARFCD